MILDELLRSTRTGALMSPAVETVLAGTPLRTALERMVEANVGSLAVIRAEAPDDADDTGLLQRGDVIGLVPIFFALRRFLDGPGGAEEPVESAMFTDLITAREDEPLSTVVPRITDNKTWRILVLGDDGHVAGLLSATDVFRLIADTLRTEQT